MNEWREVRLGDIASIVGGGTPSTKNPENYNGHITQEELDSSSAGLMSSQQSNEGKIRRTMIKRDAVDAMVALPGQLFYSTQIPACLWILAKDKTANGHRDRRGEILFIDARDLGYMADRVRREFSDEDIAKIADTYHHWRNKAPSEVYQDIPGFCKSTSLDEIKENGFVLTTGRYVRNRWRNQTNWTTKSKRASDSFRSVEMGMLFADASSEPSLLTGLTIKKETPSRANARTCDTTQSRRGATIHHRAASWCGQAQMQLLSLEIHHGEKGFNVTENNNFSQECSFGSFDSHTLLNNYFNVIRNSVWI